MKSVFLFVGLLASSMSWAQRESGGRPQASAVYVDFRSNGSGINSQALYKFDELLYQAPYQSQIVESIDQPQGREGEIVRCVHFQDAYQRQSFIQALAPSILLDEQVTRQRRTVVLVGMDCYSPQEATPQDLGGSSMGGVYDPMMNPPGFDPMMNDPMMNPKSYDPYWNDPMMPKPRPKNPSAPSNPSGPVRPYDPMMPNWKPALPGDPDWRDPNYMN